MSLKSLILAALRSGDAHQRDLSALKVKADTMTYAKYRDESARIIGERLGVEPHPSRKGGGLTFTKDSAAEQRHSRLLKVHKNYGEGSNAKREPVAVPRALVRSTVAAVIAAGLSKPEFDAFLAELKAGITFE